MFRQGLGVLAAATTVAGLAALGTDARAAPLPSFIVPGSVQVDTYDGVSDDLLSGGLNFAGLADAGTPPVPPPTPGFVDPLNPTPAELRRRAIFNNYRAIVDPVPAGGMGLLWGPTSPKTPNFGGGVTFGLIPGVEYKAYVRVPDGSGNVNNVVAIVQIPRHFDKTKRCVVAVPPSGSRGAYGGISIAEWGLFRGCAVALGGKGTGTGFHQLGSEAAEYAVDDIDGVAGSVAALGDGAQFAVKDSKQLDEYTANNPHRVATKHAHSQINPERLWGQFALRSIEFALWALNDHFKDQNVPGFERRNTRVIASGTSNGGGVSLRALEDDNTGLIDGLVVSEPMINPGRGPFVIQFGDDPPFDPEGRTLYDSITTMGTFAGCAATSPTLVGTPLSGLPPLGAAAGALQNRCASLADRGLVSGATLAEQAASAIGVLRADGYAAAQDWGIASHEFLNLWRSLQPTYAGAYGRFAVWENVCDLSFAATNATGQPAAIARALAERLFADSNGIPPTGGVNLIADNAVNGPILENLAVSRSSNRADLNLDGALCFRFLATGDRSLLAGVMGLSEVVQAAINHGRVRFGLREVQTDARLRGKPAIVFHGREDALVFPNLHSRAYYALNQVAEGASSRLRYIEVTPAQHFEAFISGLFRRPGTGEVLFAPLHFYLTWGLDRMLDHLTNGTALPPSQVVRPTARGLQPYTEGNVQSLLPPPAQDPAAGNRITFANGVLTIPE